MADVKDKKEKKEKKEKDPSKEKKEKKEKSDSKDSKEKKEKKEHKGEGKDHHKKEHKSDSKDKKEHKTTSSSSSTATTAKAGGSSSGGGDRKSFFSSLKSGSSGKGSTATAAAGGKGGAAGSSGKPAGRAPPKLKQPAVKPSDNYLDGLDLPPSEEEEEEVEKKEFDKGPLVVQATERDAKKLAEKERLAMEKALRMKAEALRDDENVFDVSFEGMGTEEATASATDVKAHNLTIRAKGKVLLENTSVTIAAGRRYGLAGPNGMGKSTLLKMMARRQIPVPENIDVLLVEQEVVGMDDQSALQAVVAADVELMKLRVEEQTLQDKMQAEHHEADFDMDEASHRLNEIYDRMNEIGASTAESRASKILHGLGFNPTMQRRPTSSFSGGWRMRISLARALYIQPTLLLLDEPTNHLDLRAVLWLEEYLMRWKKTLIVVSHDRDFLNNVTTDIIHLHDLKLHFYRGNFAQFEEMFEQKKREVNKAFEKYEKQMKAAKQSGKNSKANQEKVMQAAQRQQQKKGGKGRSEPVDDAGATTASNVPQKWNDYSVQFHFPEPTELTPPLMQLIDVDFKYPGREDFGLQNVNIGIDMGSRVAIVGPNGAGKTTLMNLLSGHLEPTSGESRRSHKLRIGRYNQHFVDALAFDENPVEYLMNKFPDAGLKPEGMRAMLGRFGLSGHHHLTPIIKLSGGQKARVVFTAISLSRPHILLLDEPTNHLDMQSIDALCDAVEEFTGGVVVISHDSQLLSKLCADDERSQVWIVDDGKIQNYDGDFDDYRNELVKEIAAELDEDEEQS